MARRKAQIDPVEDAAIKERIKRAIESKNLKIKQFARESGMAYPSLRDYHSGLRKPGFDAIASLVRFTGVSADWLILGKGDMKGQEGPPPANVDEALMAHISQSVARASNGHGEGEALKVADNDDGDYLYSRARQERLAQLNRIGKTAVIAANIYNRVAHIQDEKAREAAIKHEVETMARLHGAIDKYN